MPVAMVVRLVEVARSRIGMHKSIFYLVEQHERRREVDRDSVEVVRNKVVENIMIISLCCQLLRHPSNLLPHSFVRRPAPSLVRHLLPPPDFLYLCQHWI